MDYKSINIEDYYIMISFIDFKYNKHIVLKFNIIDCINKYLKIYSIEGNVNPELNGTFKLEG